MTQPTETDVQKPSEEMEDAALDLDFPGCGTPGPISIKHGDDGATVVILFVREDLEDSTELALQQAQTLEKIAASMRNSVAELRAMSKGGIA